MKYEITHSITSEIIFSAEIECAENASDNDMLRIALQIAVDNCANLRGADLSSAIGAPIAIDFLRYRIFIWPDTISIGCQSWTHKEFVESSCVPDKHKLLKEFEIFHSAIIALCEARHKYEE